jgi:amino acid permease
VNPEYRRISKVIDRAVFVDLLFYLPVAAAGFFSQFNDTAKIVLERGTERDIPVLIAVLGVIISILVAFPLGYNPFRSQLVMQFLKKDTFTKKENFTITTIFISITWIISVYFPHIDKVISIMGGLCAVTVSYLIPTICYVKLSEHSWTHPKNLGVLFFFGTLIVIGYSSVIIIIYLIITGK